MKNELILIGAIMLLAQVEGQMTKANSLQTELNITHKALSTLSAMKKTKEEHVFKYTSPMEVVTKTSPYGYREILNPSTGGQMSGYHKGLDIVGDWHNAIKPIVMNGKVIDVWPVPNWYYSGHIVFGGYVRIKHTDGWISNYGHLSSIYVKEGDMLLDGLFYRDGKLIDSKRILGRQGNTGLSTGEHLHLSIEKPDGTFVDPLRWVEL